MFKIQRFIDFTSPKTERGKAREGGLIMLRQGSTLAPPCGNCGQRRYGPCTCKRSKGKGGTQSKSVSA